MINLALFIKPTIDNEFYKYIAKKIRNNQLDIVISKETNSIP